MLASLWSLLRGGFRLLLFAAVLLAGIQVPAFIEQYEQRVDARYREVSANISGFQNTANVMFAGDLNALVDYYRNSSDAVFVSDADSVAAIVSRFRLLGAEQQAMSRSSVAKAWHVLFASDSQLLEETTQQYSYTIPLDAAAILWGIVLALLVTICCECLLICSKVCVRRMRKRKPLASSNSGANTDAMVEVSQSTMEQDR